MIDQFTKTLKLRILTQTSIVVRKWQSFVRDVKFDRYFVVHTCRSFTKFSWFIALYTVVIDYSCIFILRKVSSI